MCCLRISRQLFHTSWVCIRCLLIFVKLDKLWVKLLSWKDALKEYLFDNKRYQYCTGTVSIVIFLSINYFSTTAQKFTTYYFRWLHFTLFYLLISCSYARTCVLEKLTNVENRLYYFFNPTFTTKFRYRYKRYET